MAVYLELEALAVMKQSGIFPVEEGQRKLKPQRLRRLLELVEAEQDS
jgi:hypothetical protein